MNWRFLKKKKISAYDIGYLDDVNRRDESKIEQLEKYHRLLCPNISKGERGDSYFNYHNPLLSDAIKEKIHSIRDHQIETTL